MSLLEQANPALFALRAIFNAPSQQNVKNCGLESARWEIYRACAKGQRERARQWLESLITAAMAVYAQEPEMLARVQKHLDDLKEVIGNV